MLHGGLHENIVTIIWEDFQFGVQSFGTITAEVDDPRATGTQQVQYTRASTVWMWVDVNITPGEGFPTDEVSDIQASVSQSLVDFGNTLGIDEAYRAARGEEVTSSTGLPLKLGRPLDWLVITDR